MNSIHIGGAPNDFKPGNAYVNPFATIYDIVVPKDNMLRQINELVDFSFILEELKTKYCLDNGRKAVPPVRMFKYLLLKAIFELSDIDVVERSKYDMSFNYFLTMAPEDSLIDPGLLTKFRKLRLQDAGLLDMLIGKAVEIALEKEIIKSSTIIVDATHTKARCNQKSPKEFLQALIEKSQEAGMEIDIVIGDTVYSEKANLQYAKKETFQLASRLNPQITQGGRVKEDEFEFNKDAGKYVCKAGHMAIRKARTGKKNQGKNHRQKYYVDIEKCKVCPIREGCYQEGAKSKTYSVTIKSNEHTEQEAFQNSEEFKKLARERYKIEAKNSELKHRHGYEKASSAGLFGMEIQGVTAIFAVNLMRIITILKEKE